MKITVVRPGEGHKAYEIAANTFAEMSLKVAGNECVTVTDAAQFGIIPISPAVNSPRIP